MRIPRRSAPCAILDARRCRFARRLALYFVVPFGLISNAVAYPQHQSPAVTTAAPSPQPRFVSFYGIRAQHIDPLPLRLISGDRHVAHRRRGRGHGSCVAACRRCRSLSVAVADLNSLAPPIIHSLTGSSVYAAYRTYLSLSGCAMMLGSQYRGRELAERAGRGCADCDDCAEDSKRSTHTC